MNRQGDFQTKWNKLKGRPLRERNREGVRERKRVTEIRVLLWILWQDDCVQLSRQIKSLKLKLKLKEKGKQTDKDPASNIWFGPNVLLQSLLTSIRPASPKHLVIPLAMDTPAVPSVSERSTYARKWIQFLIPTSQCSPSHPDCFISINANVKVKHKKPLTFPVELRGKVNKYSPAKQLIKQLYSYGDCTWGLM